MLKKITASTVVVTIMSLSSTARADDWSWITLGQRPSCVSPEVHAPIERFIVGAAVIEARVWKGEIKPGERAVDTLIMPEMQRDCPLKAEIWTAVA
jgi:hypothetical protein